MSKDHGYLTVATYASFNCDVLHEQVTSIQVPIIPFDNVLALDQMEVAYSTLLDRPIAARESVWANGAEIAKDRREHPRIVRFVLFTTLRHKHLIPIRSLGGDHTIVLPILRALNKVYGPVSVIHFDAHLDTWDGYPGTVSDQSRITHGTFFYKANEEGLVSNSSIHAGIRCKLVVCEVLVCHHIR